MAGRLAFFLGAILLSMVVLPISATAYNSNGIEASEGQVAMVPSTGLTVGDSVTFYLTLTNTQQSEANNVGYAFYKNQFSESNKFWEDVIDIPGEDTRTVSATWDGLLETDDKVWIFFANPWNSGSGQSFFIEFDVTGLPNLRVIQTELTPSTGIHSSDQVQISSLVKNTGSENASSTSQLNIDLPGAMVDQNLPVKALNASEEVWVNTSFTAPVTGSYNIYVTPDYNDEVLEASEQDKTVSVSLEVEPRMDLYHVGDLTITPSTGSVTGPWNVSGTIGRTGQSGVTDVTMWLEIIDEGNMIVLPFSVSITGSAESQQQWLTNFNTTLVGSLAAGAYQITAVIDPFSDGGFTQEDLTNDRVSSSFIILETPDVSVDQLVDATPSTVQAGDRVTFGVNIQNNGGLEVTGNINYSFEGLSGISQIISLGPGESYYWTIELLTGAGAHTAEFVAKWIPSAGLVDRISTNNEATKNISVESSLVLNWAGSSLRILDESGESATLPLDEGEQYTFAINLTSQETGSITIDCKDGIQNTKIATIPINVTSIGQKVSLECQFTASAPTTTIQLVPSDPNVVDTYTRKLETTSPASDSSDGEQSSMGTVALIGMAAVVLIAIFALAIWLTRESEEEVERDIFEYCPACDGELEGDENRCPHCSFNLSKARKQFHSCHECEESVPDLMENCPYCGTKQDVSSFFEKRERRQKKIVPTEIALPEDDEDLVVTGTEDFAETVKEFGYDEDQLEDDWDENIASAEAEIAEIEDLYDEEYSTEGMTPEEIEEMESQVTIKLKGLKEMGEGIQDIDQMLADKGELISHKDDGSDLSASDAEIRGRLYELTGEEGVMPGDHVHIGMGLSDSSLAGNEIEEVNSDFTVEDDDQPLAKLKEPDELEPSRTKPKRRESSKKTAECGACGTEIPIMAKQCPVCGAEFK